MQSSLQALAFAATLSLGLAALATAFSTSPMITTTRVHIDSEPAQANIWLDGILQGKSPQDFSASAGTHKLELRKDGHEAVAVSLNCKRGGTVTLHQRLPVKLASLALKNFDKAEIQLGPGAPQRLRGKGPWKLAPGTYEVNALRGRLPAEPEKFELKPGQKLEISLVWPTPPSAPPLPPRSPTQPTARQPVSIPFRAYPAYQPAPVYYPPPRRPYQPAQPRWQPEILYTPIPPAHPEPPPVSDPLPPDENLFTPLP